MSRVATIAACVSITGGALVALVQTPPEVAKSNAAKWVKELTGTLPDWSPQVDALVTNIGAIMIVVGLLILLGANVLRRRRLDLAKAKLTETSGEVEPSRRIVTDDTEKSALRALRDALDNRVDPFLGLGFEVGNWTEFVRETDNKTQAWGRLYGFRYRLMPLANEIALLDRRHGEQFRSMGLSLAGIRSRLDGLVRPVENLYGPVWKAIRVVIPFLRPSIDCFPAQEEELRKGVNDLAQSVSDLRLNLSRIELRA